MCPPPYFVYGCSQARLGVVECASHELLASYPVVFAQRGATVAHFRCTVLLLPSGTSKVRPMQSMPLLPRGNRVHVRDIC